jgi:hypothetical protein
MSAALSDVSGDTEGVARQGRGDEERTAAMKSVVAELNSMRGQPRDQIARSVIDGLRDRGVDDVSDAELSFMVDAIQTSVRRAGWRLVGRTAGLFVRVAREMKADSRRYSLPDWMTYPGDLGRPPSDAQCETVDLDIGPEGLAVGRPTIARTLTDVSDQSDDADEEPVRPVNCWLSLDAPDAVLVHIGPEAVATLPPAEAARAISAIRQWGAPGHTLIADADLYGDSLETARLNLYFPAPTSEP